MTTATEPLVPALGEGLLMSEPGYYGPSAVDSGNHQALHALRYKRNPKLTFPSSASGSSAYKSTLGLTVVHSSDVGSDVVSWKLSVFAPSWKLSVFAPSWKLSVFAPKRISGPVQFVLKLLVNWRLSRDDAVLLLGFDAADKGFVRAVLAGAVDLHDQEVRDRIAHLFHIRATLSSLFRDLEVENDWLREPHTLLDERKPLKLLLGGSMEDLLLVKEYVDAAAGR